MRSGAALPAVLFAIAITSALAVSGAFVARQQATYASLSIRAGQVQPAAEEGIAAAIATWDTVLRNAQPVGSAESVPSSSLSGVAVEVWVTRTSAEVYWLVAESASEQFPPLRRRVGTLVIIRFGVPYLVPDRPWSDLP